MSSITELPPGPREKTYTPDQPFDRNMLAFLNGTFGCEAERVDRVYDEEANGYRWDFPEHAPWAQSWINRIELFPDEKTIMLYGHGIFHYPLSDTEDAEIGINYERITAEQQSGVITIESVPENCIKTVYTIAGKGPFSVKKIPVPHHPGTFELHSFVEDNSI